MTRPDRRDTCYFDGACGLCTRSRAVLGRLDWFGNLAWVDFTRAAASELPVDPAVALEGLPMRTADGRVLVGYPAVRRALRRTPIGFLPGAAMHLPGVSWAGERVYRWVAGRRGRDACATRVVSPAATLDP